MPTPGRPTGKRSDDYGTLRLLDPAQGQPGPRSGPGAERHQLVQPTSPAFSLTLSQFLNNARQQGSRGHPGQPADPARRWRAALRAADLRQRQQHVGLPAVAGHGGGVRRQAGLVRHPRRRAGRPVRRQLRRHAPATPGRRRPPPPTTGGDTPTTPTTPPPADAAALAKALADIQAAYDAGQKALKAGDFAAYGTAQKQLNEAIQRAVAAAPKGGSVTVTPTPSPTATATPTATAN